MSLLSNKDLYYQYLDFCHFPYLMLSYFIYSLKPDVTLYLKSNFYQISLEPQRLYMIIFTHVEFPLKGGAVSLKNKGMLSRF